MIAADGDGRPRTAALHRDRLAFSDPIVLGPDDELFLDQGSDCIDVGNDATATTDYGAIGLAWPQLTTALDGSLDATPVDAGVHYAP